MKYFYEAGPKVESICHKEVYWELNRILCEQLTNIEKKKSCVKIAYQCVSNAFWF